MPITEKQRESGLNPGEFWWILADIDGTGRKWHLAMVGPLLHDRPATSELYFPAEGITADSAQYLYSISVECKPPANIRDDRREAETENPRDRTNANH